MILVDITLLAQQLPVYNNSFLYLFISAIILSLAIFGFLFIKYNKLIKIFNNDKEKKIDELNANHEKKLEAIRLEMLKREDDKNRMWSESEKETLKVLSGVSNLLDLSEKINRVESDKILKELDNIKQLILNKNDR